MINELFDKYDDEYSKFDRIENKTSNRADLHAFNLLDKLLPGARDILAAAEHDQVFLSIDPEELSKVATGEQILELIRCGIAYDESLDSLYMFV